MKKKLYLNALKQIVLVLFGGLILSSFNIAKDVEWILLNNTEGIETYASIEKCGDHSLFVFKIVNTQPEEVHFNYRLEVVNDPTFPPINKEASLNTGEELAGNCDKLWELALPNSMGTSKGFGDQLSVSITINH